jgi:hypothetical protein
MGGVRCDGGIDAIVVMLNLGRMKQIADLLRQQRMNLWVNIHNEAQSISREMSVGMLSVMMRMQASRLN